MVLGWRRAFCTSIPKDEEPADSPIINNEKSGSTTSRSHRLGLGGFFSNPSTPRQISAPQTPKLQCKTNNTFFHRSNPSSPRSPSTFSLFKSTMRLSKARCGICIQRVKTGQGTAIFTAECGHSFHFPCITAQGSLTCPICASTSTWKQMHLFHTDNNKPHHVHAQAPDSKPKDHTPCVFKIYNDDEPLSSPTSGARFNPIPESDQENDEFPGFFPAIPPQINARKMEVALSSEAAVVSVGKTSETYALLLKIKAPAAPALRAPIDLVTVLNVSRSVAAEKLRLMKKAMRLVVSSLSATDRISIIAFSTTSKRLLPLRRMNTAGRRSARRIIDAIVALDGTAATSADSLKKAAKVIADRREKNPTASILIFSDGHRSGPLVSSTSLADLNIPVHSMNLSACLNAPPDDTFATYIGGLLSVVIQDLKIQLGFSPGSDPVEISAVYSVEGEPAFLGSGSSWCRVGDLHSGEERDLLIELKVPSSFGIGGARHRLLSIRCCYNDSLTQQPIYDKQRPLLIPHPRAVGSSTRDLQRLRCLFVTTRAVAESRRLAERNDVAGAQHMLASARALILQTGSGEEFVRALEAELAELNWKRKDRLRGRRRNNHEREAEDIEGKADLLRPASAWRAAERLAKLAIMRKSLNRVGDLHGFENARF